MKKIQYSFLVFIILMVLGGIIFMMYSLNKEWWRWSYDDVQVTDLQVCLDETCGLESPAKIKIGDERQIFLRGSLKTLTPIDLSIYAFKQPNKQLIYSIDADNIVQGNFSYAINLLEDSLPGEYNIDIYLFREIIASTSFEVK